MQYPKARMKISELIKLGFSRNELSAYAHIPGCPVERNGTGKTSHFVFDTDEFEIWRKKRTSL